MNKRSEKKGRIPILIGLALILAALLLTGYNFWDGYRAQRAADAVLAVLEPLITGDPAEIYRETMGDPDETEYPDYILNPEMEMPAKTVNGHDFVGILQMPTLGRTFPIGSEWNYTNLKTGPCRYDGTPYLNNMIICAHNYRPQFGTIKNLKMGDPVIVRDMDGNVFEYQVIEIEILSPHDVERMKAGEWDLTLFTCTVGAGSRVTVRCELVPQEL